MEKDRTRRDPSEVTAGFMSAKGKKIRLMIIIKLQISQCHRLLQKIS